MDRSSLKFVQEVQEAKAMDDLMDKIDKLMGGSPGTEHTGTGKFEFFSLIIITNASNFTLILEIRLGAM